MTRPSNDLASIIDHTLLKPEATIRDIDALCETAITLKVFAVCVSPTMVSTATAHLRASGVRVAAVIGFPSGAHRRDVKADEATHARAGGADEADMVINLGLAAAGDWDGVTADIVAVRQAFSHGTLKVILETALLTDAQIVAACLAAQTAGADFVKTSTGFHPAGGASIRAVQLMAATVGDRLGVKAAGGIRTARAALALVDAGATRLGLSATADILTELAHQRGTST
jgi:deoxyribose-phosphate aldolase